ncbi:MAG: hypothetical protein IJN07_00460 [Clostridia bacterium]|nr:hypothetical protein [Clostridia bacterium]
MPNTITELWYGNIDPIRHFGRNNQEIKRVEALWQRHLEDLEPLLTEKSKILFEKYNDCFQEYLSLSIEEAFCTGFSVGTKIFAQAVFGVE